MTDHCEGLSGRYKQLLKVKKLLQEHEDNFSAGTRFEAAWVERQCRKEFSLLRDYYFLRADAYLGQLTKMKLARYMSPHKYVETALGSCGVSIPTYELQRMKDLVADLFLRPDAVKSVCSQLKNATAGLEAPYITILPRVVIVDGEEIPFTIRQVTTKLWPKFKHLFGHITPVVEFSSVLNYPLDHDWGDVVKAYSNGPIQGTTGEPYGNQRNIVEDKLGLCWSHADIFLVELLHYLKMGSPQWQGALNIHDHVMYDPICIQVSRRKVSLKLAPQYTNDQGLAASIIL